MDGTHGRYHGSLPYMPVSDLASSLVSTYLTEPAVSPEDGYEPYTWAPIVYTPIYAWHLPQIHDLLGRAFWPGIDGMCPTLDKSFD
jgi:hypothetical protein